MTMKGLFKTIMMCAACAFVIGSCSTGAKTSENAAGEVEKKHAVDTLGENDGRYVKIDSLEGLVALHIMAEMNGNLPMANTIDFLTKLPKRVEWRIRK